jgi:hypothetical protein
MADNNNMSQPLSAADEKKATDFSAKNEIEFVTTSYGTQVGTEY